MANHRTMPEQQGTQGMTAGKGEQLQWRESSAPSMELLARRRLVRDMIERYPRHPEVRIHYRDFAEDGVGNGPDAFGDHGRELPCLVVQPPEVRSRMLYFHGGGFRLGSPEVSAGWLSVLAHASGCEIVAPFYSLAPKNPFPCALLEGRALLPMLLNKGLPCAVGGDSAGGNLAAVLGRWFASQLRGVLLLSPWLDLRVQAPSYESNRDSDALFSKEAAETSAELYLQGVSPQGEDVSPLLADLSQMPKTFIAVGSTEVLLEDAWQFARKLSACHRQVALHIVPQMTHVEPTLKPDTVNTQQVSAAATAFLASLAGADNTNK